MIRCSALGGDLTIGSRNLLNHGKIALHIVHLVTGAIPCTIFQVCTHVLMDDARDM